MAIEGRSVLRIFEMIIFRKIYTSMNQGECCRIQTNKGTENTLLGKDAVKFKKSLWLRQYGHVERMLNQKTAKTNCSSYKIRNKEKRLTTNMMEG
jgi:ABC-type transport system involved in Fe-S cluster assembly fused permease/ATPase subunit